jgi:hypothetical protein
MAARGTRNMDGGEEEIKDKDMVKELRMKARKIHLRAFGTAVIATLIALALP